MAEDLEEDFDDVEEGEGDESDEQPSKRKLPSKKIIFMVLPVLLVLGATAGAYFSGLADPLIAMLGGGGSSAPAEERARDPLQPAVFYDLPEMLVNLNSTGRKQSFLKIRVSLELEEAGSVPRIEQVMPRIIDNFQVYLRELRLEDLQGAAGMYRLREELLTRVNAAVKPAKVNDVLFKEMLVQ